MLHMKLPMLSRFAGLSSISSFTEAIFVESTGTVHYY